MVFGLKELRRGLLLRPTSPTIINIIYHFSSLNKRLRYQSKAFRFKTGTGLILDKRFFNKVKLSVMASAATAASAHLPEGQEEGDSILLQDVVSQVRKEVRGQVDAQAFLSSWKWLAEAGPGFPVDAAKISVIISPEEFYDKLLDFSRKARRRITLASLYLGSGKPEQELVKALEGNAAGNPDLKLKVLLDFTRGSRGTENSRKMLLPLINNCSCCEVFLYHTPALRGLVKSWLPPRWNEIIGLQHMKIYIFDDSLIISGANLSTDYFTNRQDRYLLIEDCKDLVDFYDALVGKVSDFSFKLDKDDKVSLNPDWKVHPSEGDYAGFISQAKDHIVSFCDLIRNGNTARLSSFFDQSNKAAMNKREREEYSNSEDTWIFPLIQMGGLGISQDQEATCRIFGDSPGGSHIKLATGYFNLTAEYIDKILLNSSTSYDILMAHPKANGFFEAKGFAGGIPSAYTLLAKQFLERADQNSQLYRISMREYQKEDWTYHAKGLWYYPPNGTRPAASLIGSPNFGHRSVYRDLETQLYVITLNPQLQEQFHYEQEKLFQLSAPFITTELSQSSRVVPLWVRMVIVLFRNFF